MPAQEGLNIPDPSVITGSDALVFIDGRKALYLTDVMPDYQYNQNEIRGIGSWFSLGVRSMFFSGSFSASAHLLSKPEEGSLPSLPVMEEILTSKPNILEFREKSTGRRIMRVLAKLNTEGFNLSAVQLSQRRLSFIIIRVQVLEAYN